MTAPLPKAPLLPIGAAASRSGCSVPTIRYYEDIGLLPTPARTASGQRHYGEAALRRLGFIRRCRELGFGLEQVRELVGLVEQPEAPCVQARELAARHLQSVREKLDELRTLERALSRSVCDCDSTCAGGVSADCTILVNLAVPPAQPPLAPPGHCGCRSGENLR